MRAVRQAVSADTKEQFPCPKLQLTRGVPGNVHAKTGAVPNSTRAISILHSVLTVNLDIPRGPITRTCGQKSPETSLTLDTAPQPKPAPERGLTFSGTSIETMETRVLKVVLVLCLTVGSAWADRGDDPAKTPCTGDACSQDSPRQDQPSPRGGQPWPDRQRETVIVVEEVEVRTHRVGCTQSEERRVACLQGVCYALDMGSHRNPFCECPEMYEGARCEQLSTYYFRLMYSAEVKLKAAIIGGVFFLVLLIIVLISVYFSVKKGKAKRRKAEEERRTAMGESTALKRSTDELRDQDEAPLKTVNADWQSLCDGMAVVYVDTDSGRRRLPYQSAPKLFLTESSWKPETDALSPDQYNRSTLHQQCTTANEPWRLRSGAVGSVKSEVRNREQHALAAGGTPTAELPFQPPCEVSRTELVFPRIVGNHGQASSGSMGQSSSGKSSSSKWAIGSQLPETFRVAVKWRGKRRVLTLFQSDVAASNMVMVYNDHHHNDTVVETADDNCYYNGFIRRERSSYAALSTCQGLSHLEQFGSSRLALAENANNVTTSDTGPPAPVTVDPHPRRRKRSTGRKRYLEVLMVVDHTVVAMHGKDRVKHYVMTLMNIQRNVIIKRNAYGTVQRFCQWVAYHHSSVLAKHDIAVLLTRENMGPAGYAPITGMCNPSRSCAAITDEGFTSGFIIAHEMAHVFGLFHDGHGNHCTGRRYQTAIMAPLVETKLNNFWWSECSRQRMEQVVKSVIAHTNYMYYIKHRLNYVGQGA
ncbi:hypothetical protein BaRGS_00010217 [Batillaria attramentaria]|uniref:Peptidase M12B domain-containing protein n=1 Tax=Batillaria attramentaria TaxID=370345 RepID=A0ABD0LGD3_9CAEN